MVISNGPFKLTRYDPPAQFAELTANRHPDYPFSAGDWSFGEAELVRLAETPSQPLQIGAENELSIRLEGPGSLGLQYTLYDPAENQVLAQGLAESGGTGSGGFRIKLDQTVGDALQPGLYQLFLGAFSDAVSTMTQRRIDLEATIDGPVAVVAEPTAVPQAQPTTAPQQQEEEESGGGCGRGSNIELVYPLAGLALLGLVFRRRLIG
jgi:peptide/nickel transport system substrate-binding protein